MCRPHPETGEENVTKTTDQGNRRAAAERRREIIDAAAAIFTEKGYAATSIQDVADAVDILKGSLYYYIDSKDDLLYEVIQEVHEGGLENLERAKLYEGTALEKIRGFVWNHITYNAENLTKIAVFFHDFMNLSEERRDHIQPTACSSMNNRVLSESAVS